MILTTSDFWPDEYWPDGYWPNLYWPASYVAEYTRGDIADPVVDDSNLETAFLAQDYTDVESDNDVRVAQTASDPEHTVFLFKNKNDAQEKISVTWNGKTSRATSQATVFLEIYNRIGTAWEVLDSETVVGADTDFTLEGSQTTDLGNYYDGDFRISCRVRQSAA